MGAATVRQRGLTSVFLGLPVGEMNLIQALAHTEDQTPSMLLWSFHLVTEKRIALQEMGLVASWCWASDGGMSMYLQTMSPNFDDPRSSEGAPRVTPGLIMSHLSKERLQDLSSHLNMPIPAIV